MPIHKCANEDDMNSIHENIRSSNSTKDSSRDLSSSANTRPIRFRFIRAFGVTFGILINLGLFHLWGKFLGKEWENSRRPAVYGENAQRLKRLLLSLAGIFIKAGQLISILSNFLPDYFRKELEELQDKIPPRPVSEMYRAYPKRAEQRSESVICRIRSESDCQRLSGPGSPGPAP